MFNAEVGQDWRTGGSINTKVGKDPGNDNENQRIGK